MKSVFLSAIFIATSISVFAEKEIKVKAKINSATVYLQGAEINNRFSAVLPQGSSTVIVEGLPANLNQQTLQVGSVNGVTIQSTEYRINYMNQNQKSPRVKMIEDSLEIVTLINSKIDNQRQVDNEALSILQANKIVGGANVGLSVLELQKLMDFNFKKSTELKADILDLDLKDKKNQEKINQLNSQLAQENAKQNQPTGEVVLQVFANTATNADFNMSYVNANAGWNPIYDLRCENVQSKIKLYYKAQVWNNTGLAWSDVKLTISTGNPNEGGTSPVLQPWYLSFYQPSYYNTYSNAPAAAMTRNESMAAPKMKAYSLDKKAADVYQNVEQTNSLAAYTTVTESQLNATFEIDLKYDIPSDGKTHLVSMIDYELPATYQYYAVPKLDKDAFLLARITDWEKLNLLPANANIFFEGTYVGQSFVDTRNTRDTLSFSMGRDKKIIIKRTKVKDYSARKVIGSTRKESFTYDITVRNTKKDAVSLIMLDQYPITTDKDIEIELLEKSNASDDKDKGQLQWRFDLKSQENKTLRLSYSVKYPKDKTIGNLN